jgi:hypothetical protein
MNKIKIDKKAYLGYEFYERVFNTYPNIETLIVLTENKGTGKSTGSFKFC